MSTLLSHIPLLLLLLVSLCLVALQPSPFLHGVEQKETKSGIETINEENLESDCRDRYEAYTAWEGAYKNYLEEVSDKLEHMDLAYLDFMTPFIHHVTFADRDGEKEVPTMADHGENLNRWRNLLVQTSAFYEEHDAKLDTLREQAFTDERMTLCPDDNLTLYMALLKVDDKIASMDSESQSDQEPDAVQQEIQKLMHAKDNTYKILHTASPLKRKLEEERREQGKDAL